MSTAAKSPLPLLIRRARSEVDERRVELAGIEAHVARAADLLARHDRQAEAETAFAGRDTDALSRFAGWSRYHARQRTGFAERLAALERTRDSALHALREACAGLKRLELAHEAREAERLRRQARRDQAKAEDMEMLRRPAVW